MSWRSGTAAAAAASGGTPAPVLSTTNAAGVASTFLRTDDQLALFDATVPVTQAHGDSASAGSAAITARRDHKHAFANLSGNVTTTNSMVTTIAAGVVTPAMMATNLNTGSGLTSIGQYLVAVGTGDVTKNNNSTLADATGLAFAIAANERWFMEAYVLVTHASANADAKFGLTFPVSCTADWGINGAAGGTLGGYGGWPAASTGVVPLTISGTLSLGGVAGDVAYGMAANIANSSTGGTIQLQFAQVTNTVENTILRGTRSFLRCTRLA